MPRSRAGPRHAEREAVVVATHLLRDHGAGSGRQEGERAARRGRVECERTEHQAMERRTTTPGVELLVDDHDGCIGPGHTAISASPRRGSPYPPIPPTWKTRSKEASANGSACASAASRRIRRPGWRASRRRQRASIPSLRSSPRQLHVELARQIAVEEGQVRACPDADLEDAELAAISRGAGDRRGRDASCSRRGRRARTFPAAEERAHGLPGRAGGRTSRRAPA